MGGWHHQLNGHEFEQALGVGDGHVSLVCCSPWSHKELDTIEQLNKMKIINSVCNKTNIKPKSPAHSNIQYDVMGSQQFQICF